MKVMGLNGKKKKIDSIKIIQHESPDITGGTVMEEYVEVEVIGKQSTWTEWWLLSEFMDNNPDFELEA